MLYLIDDSIVRQCVHMTDCHIDQLSYLIYDNIVRQCVHMTDCHIDQLLYLIHDNIVRQCVHTTHVWPSSAYRIKLFVAVL